MAHIVVNAINLKSGGGLQVAGALLARFSERHRYTVLWNDHVVFERISALAGQRANVSYANPVGTSSNVQSFVWMMRRLPRYLRSIGADAVLSVNHHYPSGRVPQVVYHMNVLRFERPRRGLRAAGELADRLRDWRARIALRRADANLFESEYLRGVAERHGAIRNPGVVYIGLDERRPVPSPDPDAGRSCDILAITSPQPHKDNPVLVRMLARLVKLRPDEPWRLRVAGGRTPEAFADLKALADELRVGGRIEWLGFQDHGTLSRLGASSLCLVTPSRVESFCMVALEAMSWGCPAIVADATAMPESVVDAGLIVRPGDADGFAEAVLRLREEPGLRHTMVLRGLALARERSWSGAADEVEAVLDRVTGRP